MDFSALLSAFEDAKAMRYIYFSLPVVILCYRWAKGRWDWELNAPVLWIFTCELLGYLMMVSGRWNVVVNFLYAPVAIVLMFLAYRRYLTDNRLYWLAFSISTVACFVIMGHGLWYHEVWRMGIERSPWNYAIAAPAIICLSFIVEINRVIYPQVKVPYAARMMNLGWMLYFMVGYIHWGLSNVMFIVSPGDTKDLVRSLWYALLSLGYALLWVFSFIGAVGPINRKHG